MESASPEFQTLLDLLEKKTKMVAMLAPSFPIEFSYPEIVGRLKRLGFSYVVEVARGAIETNRQFLELVKKNPQARYILSPCPAMTRLIRNKYPQLKPFLSPTKSPMINTAELVLKEYPQFKPVFIGPCPVKRFEANEDFSQLGILVLTYREVKRVLALKGIKPDSSDDLASFDIAGPQTRLYPISGGLTQSADLNNLLTDEEYDVVSGLDLVKQALVEFPKNKVKALDILFCEGGCIAGQGIESALTPEERRKKVIAHWAQASHRL